MESRYDDRRGKITIRNDLVELNIKNDFPIFSNNKDLIYLDNASTTQKPQVVINKLIEFYTKYNSNIHRAEYKLANIATKEYEESRQIVADFINANKLEIIFTRGTTESINLIAYSWGNNLYEDDEILISEMEHHSNIIPWQMLAKQKNIKIKYIPILENGELDIKSIKDLINDKTKLVSLTHMSNTLGTINPVNKIIKKIKQYNSDIKILIDGAQSISHIDIDVKKINCDFFVFSGHKIMGPTGVGALYIKKKLMNEMVPFLMGGQMIKEVNKFDSTWNDSPWKFEAGTSNIAQVIGFGEAINYFNKLDIKNINTYENMLLNILIERLKEIKPVKIYGHIKNQGPVISFNIKNCHPYDVSKLLDTYNIAIRSGHHCTQTLMKSLGTDYTNRVSLYAYNSLNDINYFVDRLIDVIKILN